MNMNHLIKISVIGLSIPLLFILLTRPQSATSTTSAPQEKINQEHALSLLAGYKGEDFKTTAGKEAVNKAIAYVESFGITPYDFGSDLNYQGDTEESIYWYESLAIATNDPSFYYGRAYYLWTAGDSNSAMRDVNFLIMKKLTPIIKARTYYLRGQIHLEGGHFERADEDFTQALETYRGIDGKYGGQYLCLTMLAQVAISLKQFDRVRPLLESAKDADRKSVQYGNKPYGMSVIHEILGAMYFEQRRFKEALEENVKSREAYLQGGREEKAEGILVKVGLLQFITGDPKSAYETSAGIWKRLENTSHTKLWAYNNLTLMMLARCANMKEDYQVRKSDAFTWAKSDIGGQALIDLANFLEHEVPCPKLKETKK